MYFHRFLLLLFSFAFMGTAFAQKSVWDDAKNVSKNAKGKLGKETNRIKKWKDHIKQWGTAEDYNHQLLVGGRLNSNGWSGALYYFTKAMPGLDVVWSLSFSEVKHEKQVKQERVNSAFPELGKATPFVFGKVNNLYLLQLGHGREYILLPGVVKGNISIGLRFSGGFSLAMLKPYYLRLIYVDYSQPDPVPEMKEERYSAANSDKFLKPGDILGASKWSKGLNKVKYIPGAFLDAAVVIRPVVANGFVQSVTLGTNIAYHTKALPIMAELKAYPWEGCLYIGLAIGKRWR